MTVIQLTLMLLAAHFVADFIFQPQKWCDAKEQKAISTIHLYHSLIVALFAWVLSLDLYFFWFAILIGFFHLLIDSGKSYYVLKHASRKSETFFVDQLLHLAALCLIAWLYLRYYEPKYLFSFHLSLHRIAMATAFLFCSKPANIFIKNIFELFHLTISKNENKDGDDSTEKDLENAGQLIGIVERFMTLAMILSSQYAAVGLIITAKSILRFRSQEKNEYILVGTLLSFGCAILIGILINHCLSAK